jgi:hypothetical protein
MVVSGVSVTQSLALEVGDGHEALLITRETEAECPIFEVTVILGGLSGTLSGAVYSPVAALIFPSPVKLQVTFKSAESAA